MWTIGPFGDNAFRRGQGWGFQKGVLLRRRSVQLLLSASPEGAVGAVTTAHACYWLVELAREQSSKLSLGQVAIVVVVRRVELLSKAVIRHVHVSKELHEGVEANELILVFKRSRWSVSHRRVEVETV